MRKKGKRLISLALILTMILTLLPQSAINSKAASKTALNGLANKDIGLESSGSANWEVGESTVTGSVAGKKIISTIYSAQNGIITFTNKKTTKATLSFHYTLEQNGGTVEVPKGTAVTTEGDYSVELDAGATVECYIKSSKSTNVTKLILTEIRLVSDTTATTTFVKAEHGSYTVDGTAVTDTYTKTQSSTVPYELEATADAGYKFVGWYDETNGKYISSEKKASLNIEQDITIVPKFIDEKVAGFSVESQKFFDLNEAIEYAKKNNIEKITLCESGSISGNYTIPEGITLLIPFDSAETLYTTTPGYTTETPAQKAYKTLTLESGSTINVEGAISVGGKHYTSSTQYCCRTIGEYGQIKMLAGSSINLKQGSNLYAWGYITGEGTLQANSGSNVYEYFQIADWRGGNAASSAIGTHKSSKIFPFSQYYVQNIENAITFEAGAHEYTYVSITASLIGTQSVTVPFIGESGLFTLSEGSTITKKYNPQTDRMTFTVNGDAAVNSIAMKVGSTNVNSADYVLPLNNNIDLKVDKGTLTANKDIALLPGVTVSVAEDACLQVASGAAVYVYDMDQWNSGYIYTSSGNYAPVAYTPSGRGSRSLADVKIDVNGKLIVAGELYTTESGADICSSKNTGVYVQEGTPGTATATHQFTQSGSTLTVNDIPITPAKLHNTDGSYTETKDAKAGDSYTVSEEGKWVKVKRLYTVTWVDEDGTELEKDENVEEGTVPEYNGKTPTKAGDAQYSYTFKGWTPEVSEVTDNIIYKATYEQTVNKYKVTWKNADGTELATDDVAYGEVPEYNGKTPEKAADEKHTYEFIGWTPEVKEVTGDMEYTAVFKENIKTYTATWVDENGKQLQKTTDIPCGETREYTGEEPTKAGDAQYSYKFKGWNQAVDEKTGDITYTATYEQTVNKYKISWVNDNGDVLSTEEVAYGETPVYSGATPEKAATDEYTYTFKGWTPEVTKVTEDATYKATYDSVKNNYKVTWKNYDGSVLQTDDNVEYGTMPSYNGKTPERAADDDNTYAFAGWTPEVSKVTKNIEYTAKYTATPIERHKVSFDANGGKGEMDAQTFVQGKDVVLKENAFTRDNYVFTGWNTKADGSGVSYADQGSIMNLTEDITLYAQWKIQNGLEYDGDDIYYVKDGERVLDAGLVKIKDAAGNNLYYYFGKDGKAVKNVPVGGQDYWISKTNDLLPEWGYYFNADGTIVHDSNFQNGIQKDSDNKLCYYVDGIKVHKGMFEENGNIYYAKSNGSLIVNGSYYCTRNNGLKAEGTYTFDENGKMVQPDENKNGIVSEDGSMYYYKSGERYYAGLIEIDGAYYYVKTSGEVVHGKAYWISKTNGLLPEQSYTFADDGKLVQADKNKNGIVSEDGTMYYYQNGIKTYAGLIEIDGAYYYVKTSGEVVHGKNYWITKTNGLLPEQSYTFADDGKLVQADKTKNGIVSEDGTMYYYQNGIKTYAGLIKIDGAYYYVKSSGEVVHGRKYWITKTNGLMPEKSYTFADDGKLVQ